VKCQPFSTRAAAKFEVLDAFAVEKIVFPITSMRGIATRPISRLPQQVGARMPFSHGFGQAYQEIGNENLRRQESFEALPQIANPSQLLNRNAQPALATASFSCRSDGFPSSLLKRRCRHLYSKVQKKRIRVLVFLIGTAVPVSF